MELADYEIYEGEGVVRTVEETMEKVGKLTYPITVIRLRSEKPFLYTLRGETHLVDAVTITDSGKYGISTIYTVHKDYTEEERRIGRENIQRAIRNLMVNTGNW